MKHINFLPFPSDKLKVYEIVLLYIFLTYRLSRKICHCNMTDKSLENIISKHKNR
jgi:hypothetical protein